MAEENQGAAGANQANQQQGARMGVQHVYLRDASFEAPNVLELDQSSGQPDVNLNLSQRSNQIDENRWEVVLSITVTSKQAGKTAFLCEVHYGGIFQFGGFTEQQLPYVINVLCPDVLFPYCRNQISSMVSAGGFYMPPLQPINFEAIFRQRLEQAQQEGDQNQQANGQDQSESAQAQQGSGQGDEAQSDADN
ncbi:protein-export chaperone SecB [Wenzhouxiangella sp. AB-CW3]|uniref:protein-export chaperone SecB n=1 Tax=Wenzhouxiangella sp. AB-CW3 TaxID=2771012 RepID=UPI00168B1E44|nr:protein-export chaperone SecB [Wenzhouxiangella sp. AB-CW3]QOC24030.1 protein-export chaperone SecB [Wenzhouxiangella sp. AB-CW3]